MLIRRLFFPLLLFSAAFIQLFAEWTLYPYTSTYQRVCQFEDHLYILKSGVLFRANIASWHNEHRYSREDGLTGTNIVDICCSEEANRLAIVYEDGNIDIICPDGQVSTIPDIANAPMEGADKSIISVREQQGQLFVLTGYGFFVVDLQQALILQNFQLGFTPTCAWSYADRWYYSTQKGIYYCAKNANPFAPGAWRTDDSPVIDQAFVFTSNGVEQCWLRTKDNCIRKLTPTAKYSILCSKFNIKGLYKVGHYMLAVTQADSTIIFDTDLGPAPATFDTPRYGQVNTCHDSLLLSIRGVAALDSDGRKLALLHPTKGIWADSLIITPANNGAGKAFLKSITTQPLSIISSQQNGQLNRILISADNLVNFSYIPLLNTGYSNIVNTGGELTTYQPTTNYWKNSDNLAKGSELPVHTRLCGVTSFTPDPKHTGRYWFGTLEDGIIGIENDKFLCYYNHSNTGSTGLGLTALPNICRIGSLCLSPNGDLWCTNEGVIHLLACKEAGSDNWYHFQIPGLEQTYGFSHLIHTTHGGRHQLWGNQQMSYEKSNVFCYDYGDSVANLDDDRYVAFRELTPHSDQGTLSPAFIPYYGRGIFESPLGAIWLLNTSGLFAIDNPDEVFEHPGEVRTILSDVIPTSAATDANGNVWVGTENNGLYLLSADGRTQLENLTTKNSPLPSNEILDIACDTLHSTLWISTNGCILSYQYNPADYRTLHKTISSAYCWPSTVHVTIFGKDNTSINQTANLQNENSLTAITIFNLQDSSSVSLLNSQGRTLLQSTALGGILNLDTTNLPIGRYTIQGTDSQSYSGSLCSFDVEE